MKYASAVPDLLKRANPLAKLRKMHLAHVDEIDAWLTQHDRRDASALWQPVVTRDTDRVEVLDNPTGKLLGTIALDPWQPDKR